MTTTALVSVNTFVGTTSQPDSLLARLLVASRQIALAPAAALAPEAAQAPEVATEVASIDEDFGGCGDVATKR